MAKRIGPEAKIIALFTALSPDSKRIVYDMIRSQMTTPRKPSTKKKVDASGTGGIPPITGITAGAVNSASAV